MSMNLRRVATAAVAAGAMAVGVAGTAFASDDAPSIEVDAPVVVSPVAGPTVYRIADRDRIGTAIEAMQTRCWGPDAANNQRAGASGTIVLASSENFADALAAGPLADVANAPILTTPNGDSLEPRVKAAIAAAHAGTFGMAGCGTKANRVTIVSGEGVLRAGIVEELNLMGLRVDRYSGANRYQTSAVIAAAVWNHPGFQGNRNAGLDLFFADGDDFPDALTSGAAAAEHNGVVLLTMGARGVDTSAALLASLNGPYSGTSASAHREIWAVGGNAAKALANGFGTPANPIEPSNTVVGADRYATAAMLAGKVFGNPKDFVVASGENYPDGVVAGAYAANLDAPLLLTTNGAVPTSTADYLKAKVDNRERVFVFGGPSSVSVQVSQDIATYFNY